RHIILKKIIKERRLDKHAVMEGNRIVVKTAEYFCDLKVTAVQKVIIIPVANVYFPLRVLYFKYIIGVVIGTDCPLPMVGFVNNLSVRQRNTIEHQLPSIFFIE